MCDKGTAGGDVDYAEDIGRQLRQSAALDDAPNMTVSSVFDVLRDRRRRVALTTLREATDSQATIQELAASLREHPQLSLSPGQAALTIHHTVLPKLTDVGLITHDVRAQSVRYVGHPLVDVSLDLATNWEDC